MRRISFVMAMLAVLFMTTSLLACYYDEADAVGAEETSWAAWGIATNDMAGLDGNIAATETYQKQLQDRWEAAKSSMNEAQKTTASNYDKLISSYLTTAKNYRAGCNTNIKSGDTVSNKGYNARLAKEWDNAVMYYEQSTVCYNLGIGDCDNGTSYYNSAWLECSGFDNWLSFNCW